MERDNNLPVAAGGAQGSGLNGTERGRVSPSVNRPEKFDSDCGETGRLKHILAFERYIRNPNGAVMSEDGNLEHFLGDQFLSYWSTPWPHPDAADRALRAAYVLIEGMDNYRLKLPHDLRELFAFGVALHCGRALVGNKGSSLRLDYGVVGDLVNTAARAESLTRYYGVRLLVTRDFYVQLSNPPGAVCSIK